MIRRFSIYASTHTILSESFSNLTFTHKSLFFSSSSSSSSSSLVIVPDTRAKPLSSPLYNLLPPNQNPNNIVNLISNTLKLKSSHLSLSLLQNDIQGILPHMGAHEISRVLLRCQSDHSSALTYFNWVRNDLGIKPTLHNYCILVHILAWSRVFSEAMKLLSELVEEEGDSPNEFDIYQNLVACTEDCNWNPVIFDMLIKAYVKAGMVEKGLETFRKNTEACFIPSVTACNCLLNGLSKFDYIGHCWEVYEEMGRLGIHRNAYTFNILTHVLCKDGDADKVNGFLNKMEEEGFEPDLVTYNTLINSYCRKGRLEDAFYLNKIMCIRGVMPNLITYTALINGLCKEGRIKEAHQLFHQMVHRGLDPDIVSYNTLIGGYCREGKMQMCRSLLHEMIGNGISPDHVTCWLVIEGHAREKKLVSALNLVVELQRFGIKIPKDVYDYLIVALCKEGRPFAARSLLLRISQEDRSYMPEMSTYNKLIESLCEFNHVEEAVTLKSTMNMSVKLNLSAYRAIISGLCCVNRTQEAEGLLEEMISSGIQPDLEITRALVNAYCKVKDVDKAVSLLMFFAKEIQVYDSESYNAIVKVFCEDGNVAELMEVQDRLLKVGYVPNSLTCKHVIHGLQKAMELDDE